MAGSATVLIIDDEPVLQDVLGSLLRGDGFDCQQATTAADGMRLLREEEIDVVLLDLMLPDRSGLELLPDIKAYDPHLPVVVITAYSSVESAIEAMRGGAFHYVPKPFKNEEVLHLVHRAAERRALLVENLQLRSRLEGMGEIVGTSRRIEEVFELMRRAAPARSTILVVGESGTVYMHNNGAYLGFAGKALTERTESGRLRNVTRYDKEIDAIDLPSNSVDRVLMVMTYHDLYYKTDDWDIDPGEFFAAVRRILKPGGMLCIVDHAGRGTDLPRSNPRKRRRVLELSRLLVA